MSDSGVEPQPGPPSGARPARYPRTTNGLIGSLIVTVLVVGAVVGLGALNGDKPEVKPTSVDYLSAVGFAQEGGYDVVYPSALPEGWMATSLDFTPGDRPDWGVGMLTDRGTFVGLRQEDASLGSLLATYVDEESVEGAEITVEGSVASVWRSFSDEGGDLAFAAEVGEDTVLVYGSASSDDLLLILESLTTEPRQD